MWTWFSRKQSTKQPGTLDVEPPAAILEPLELRRLLSATVAEVMKPDILIKAAASSNAVTSIQGYTPTQIKTAYDLNGLSFNGVSGDGAGQTIAIVDAYNDPSIAADLAVFDTEFGLSAPASFKVVNQTGGTKLPTNDAGWASEISLDVEWSHAIAPGANILLVEASSDSTTDLLSAVDYARNTAGVSVVSMSWGGSEFFSFGSGGEFESETTYDTYFTTPAGHEGVTFIAAAGDSGSQDGVEWPAVSPNVLSVGGTSLYTSDDAGTYQTETGWSGTSGGFSQIETKPAYQDVVQTSEFRSSPDVSYDGDPDTGFAVYDSVADDGYTGWQEVGGTSAGSPQWAAIVAIADQGRVLSGNSTLDGVSQTLPTLYSLYTTTNNDYADNFNDVTSGGSGGTHFRWGGFGDPGSQASSGYDTVTGLGTPQGASLITTLAGSTVTSTSGGDGGSGSSGSGSGSNTTATLPASQVDVTIVKEPALSATGGASASVTLQLVNDKNVLFSGPVSITIYASTDGTVSSSALNLTTVNLGKLGLKSYGSKLLKVRFTYPIDATAGSYYLVASITATNAGTAPSVATSTSAVNYAPPFADLAVSFAEGSPLVLKQTGKDSAVLEITNEGNVTATGTFSLTLNAADLFGVVDEQLATFSSKRITLKAGKSTKVKVSFAAPTSGDELVATLVPSVNPTDTVSSDDQAITTFLLS